MADENGRYIAYYRVSTDRQGQSGLGLEAQQAAVEQHLKGGDWTLIESYTEIESGKRNDRPEIAKALAACKRHKATLVIAKLDRHKDQGIVIGKRCGWTHNLGEAARDRYEPPAAAAPDSFQIRAA